MRRFIYTGALLLVSLVVTGLAVARSQSGEVREVSGEITAHVRGTPKLKNCDAPNDHTFQVRGKFLGTLSSSDARLAGDVEIKSTLTEDADTGAGISEGRVTVRNPHNGRVKLAGRYVAATTGLTDDRFQGVIDARLAHHGGRFVANFTVENPDENLTGEFGKDAPIVPTNKAVVSTAC